MNEKSNKNIQDKKTLSNDTDLSKQHSEVYKIIPNEDARIKMEKKYPFNMLVEFAGFLKEYNFDIYGDYKDFYYNIKSDNRYNDIKELFFDLLNLHGVNLLEKIDKIQQDIFLKNDIVDLIIPSNIKIISKNAFKDYTGLKSVVIEEGLEQIEDSAFSNCIMLESVKLPKSLKAIGKRVFNNCPFLDEIEIANGNKKYKSINNCLIDVETKTIIVCGKNCEIPDDENITSIGSNAFDGRTINKIVIPKNITYINELAFNGCTSLTTIFYKGDEEEFKKIKNVEKVFKDKDIYFYSEDKPLGFKNYWHYDSNTNRECKWANNTENINVKNKNEVLQIPQTVSIIKDRMLFNLKRKVDDIDDSIKKVVIPSTVTEILSNAFENCSSLQSVVIPDSVTKIDSNAFLNCTSLQSIKIGKNVSYIAPKAFDNCINLSSVTVDVNNKNYKSSSNGIIDLNTNTLILGCKNCKLNQNDNIKVIGEYAFSNCVNLEKIDLPITITQIKDYAFNNCTSLKQILIPNNVNYLSQKSFNNCTSLESIKVSSGNTSYFSSDNTIIDKQSKTLILGCKNSKISSKNITSIGPDAFNNCVGLKKIIIPNNIEKIESTAFSNCINLEEIEIPKSVKTVQTKAFFSCTSLKKVTLNSQLETIKIGAFANCNCLEVVYFKGNITEYNSINIASMNDPLINAERYYYLEDEPSFLGNFYHYDENGEEILWNSKTLEIENGITEIKRMQFFGKTGIEKIILPTSLKCIKEQAFASCSMLKEIFIPKNVEVIEENAFSNCNNLSLINVDEQNPIFYSENNCIIRRDNKEIVIGCKTSQIPSDVKSIGVCAFSNCYSLSTITIPGSVKKINENAFSNCTFLQTITLCKGIEKIYENAFSNCESLKDVYYLGSEDDFYKIDIARGNELFKQNCRFSLSSNLYVQIIYDIAKHLDDTDLVDYTRVIERMYLDKNPLFYLYASIIMEHFVSLIKKKLKEKKIRLRTLNENGVIRNEMNFEKYKEVISSICTPYNVNCHGVITNIGTYQNWYNICYSTLNNELNFRADFVNLFFTTDIIKTKSMYPQFIDNVFEIYNERSKIAHDHKYTLSFEVKDTNITKLSNIIRIFNDFYLSI